jgi:hypothetical protein
MALRATTEDENAGEANGAAAARERGRIALVL